MAVNTRMTALRHGGDPSGTLPDLPPGIDKGSKRVRNRGMNVSPIAAALSQLFREVYVSRGMNVGPKKKVEARRKVGGSA